MLIPQSPTRTIFSPLLRLLVFLLKQGDLTVAANRFVKLVNPRYLASCGFACDDTRLNGLIFRSEFPTGSGTLPPTAAPTPVAEEDCGFFSSVLQFMFGWFTGIFGISFC